MQPGGGQGGPGMGGRGMGGFNFDPSQIFDRIANGKEVITRNDMNPPERFDQMAQNMGITNGRITRQQFVTYMQERMANRGAGGGPGRGGPGGGGPGGDRGGRGGDPSSWAERSFQRLDQNGDGLLNFDEMPESLRIERDKWDANKDGFIDLNEYKGYIQARLQQFQQEGGMGGLGMGSLFGSGRDQDDEEEKKPTVYRAGNLPRGLPAWFTELDEDEDAQIGLYEWKKSGRTMAEFAKIDRNGDGFLTVDEVLRYVGQSPDGNGDSTGSPGTRPSFAGGPPSFGGNGGPPGGGRMPSWGGGSPGGGMPSWGGGPPGGGMPMWPNMWGNRGGGQGGGRGPGGMEKGMGRPGGNGMRGPGGGGDRGKGKDKDRRGGNG
jgi:Ca2+-binding EF-hand superfamily protein